MVFYTSKHEIEKANSGEGFAGLFSVKKEGKYQYKITIDEVFSCFSCDADFVAEDKNKLPQGYFCDNCIINPADKNHFPHVGKMVHGDNVEQRLQESIAHLGENSVSNFAIVMINKTGQVVDCWANSSEPFVLVGALESLKFDFMRKNI